MDGQPLPAQTPTVRGAPRKSVPAEHQFTTTYRFAMGLLHPIVGRWGRMRVNGIEHLPLRGGVILAGNHDSHWDPVAVGMATRTHRPISALAKASMWKRPGLRHVLEGMRQIPIQRGAGDAAALAAAVERLRAGGCIGVFPEGTLSHGAKLRARSGVGRLRQAVPEATVVAFAVQGTVDLVRFPKRPRIVVTFFRPRVADAPVMDPEAFAQQLMTEVRALAPAVPAGRSGALAAGRVTALGDRSI